MRPLRVWPLALVAFSLCFQPAADAADPEERTRLGADADLARLAHEHVDRVVELAHLKARREALAGEIQKLAAGGPKDFASREFDSNHEVARLILDKVRPAVDNLQTSVDKGQSKVEAEAADLAARWHDVRTEALKARTTLFEMKGNRHTVSQLAFLLSADNRWFWLASVIAVGSLVAAALLERRQEWRRVLNGGRARALGLSKLLSALLVFLIACTLVVFLCGTWIYNHFLLAAAGQDTTPRQFQEQENARLADEVEQLRAKCAALEAEWRKSQSRWESQPDNGLNADLRPQWIKLRNSLIRVHESLAVERTVSEKMQSDIKDLQALDQELTENAEAVAGYVSRKQWIECGLGVFLLSMVGTGAYFLDDFSRRRTKQTADTCPLCLGVGQLQAADIGIQIGIQTGASADEAEMVQCQNGNCDFAFMSLYRTMTKLCFPTLGHSGSGKTHWLAMTYRELNRGNYPAVVQFEKVKSSSSGEFDKIVDALLDKRVGPEATMTRSDALPHPLIFNFRDRDRLGRSSLLTNVFDYAGYVTTSTTLDDPRRRRALDADGYLFFLDPTEPSDIQAAALNRFREDVRIIKKVRAGRTLQAPVALVVSKIDLMVNRPYAARGGRDLLQRFYEQLNDIDPTGEQLTLKVIEARSRLMVRLRETIWPGWKVERSVNDLFGGRYMFFPQTPVGLDHLGQQDLSQRMITPFAILEPLLWLLHMNGYPVLD
jgi:cell division protein FtsB